MLYFDNAATSFPKAPNVPEAVYDFLKNIGANAGRGSYENSIKTTEILFEVKEKLATIFNIADDERIALTSGTTESLNTAIFGFLKKGMKVLTSNMEHNAVMRTLNYLVEQRFIQVEIFDINNGTTDFLDKLKCDPDFVITTAASNVTGQIFPFQEIGEILQNHKAVYCVDAAQIAGSYPIDVQKCNIDILCAPGHKSLLGPTGTGFIYIKNGIPVKSFKYGGTGSQSESELQPNFMPDKFESGTLNLSGFAGLNSSLDFIVTNTVQKLFDQKIILCKYFMQKLAECENLTSLTIFHVDRQAGVFSVVPKNMTISELTHKLDKREIAVRMGFHCAPAAHKSIGTTKYGGTVRFSLGYSHTEKDIDELFKNLHEILD